MTKEEIRDRLENPEEVVAVAGGMIWQSDGLYFVAPLDAEDEDLADAEAYETIEDAIAVASKL
jgi:hypothetical protein